MDDLTNSTENDKRFDFGENWRKYSISINSAKLEKAIESIRELLDVNSLHGKSFLDIGCGSGLFSIAAYKLGAEKILGVDINQKSIDSSFRNAKYFGINNVLFKEASILDSEFVKKTEKHDIVYAWGSLHHTGNMYLSIENALHLVKKEGFFIAAIYNRHFTSKIWKAIKRIYNLDSTIIKKILEMFYFLSILPINIIVYPERMLKKNRGMSIYYDVIDWLGGFPYEYASPEEIVNYIEKRGFKLIKLKPAFGMTGCNEYVFVNKNN